MRTCLTALVLAAFALPLSAPVSATEVEIREWTVPWPQTRPRDPAVAADGRIWFVGQSGHYAAVFDPETESFKRYELPRGAGPHTVIVTRAGEIWYAGNRAAHLGRLDPESGEIERVDLPEDTARDPHSLAEDSRGRIWFTAQQSNHVGRYDPASGELDLVAVESARARPYGIAVDGDDRPWIALLGTNRLATVDPASLELEEIELPREQARPRRVAITSQGIWYVDYNQGYLGVYDPGDCSIEEWPAPNPEESGPYAMAADDRERLWFVETWPEPNRFVGFDPAAGEFFGVTPIPSGAGAVRHMVFDPETRSIWFGTDTNNLGRARLVDPD